mmetsp:Transcript_24363/g.67406  ORF Transcript_24363/g.67406 Transcript_24363/m.67406 type:complete len:212 (-) Transcript_24363:1602-2237(-)
MPSSSSASSSSSIERPSLTRRWIREAKVAGSSRENPDVNNEVSYINQIKSLTVLSLWSASAFSRRAEMIALVGLTSMVFLEVMYWDCEASRSAWAFIIRSMLADHPYSPVTKTQGESARRLETTTFSTLSPNTSFMSLHSGSVLVLASSKAFFSSSSSARSSPSLEAERSFFPSNSFNCCTAYSSMGSTMYKTSYPFFWSFSRKGEVLTAW